MRIGFGSDHTAVALKLELIRHLEEQGDGKEQDSRGMRRYMKVIIWFQLVTIALVVLQILGLL